MVCIIYGHTNTVVVIANTGKGTRQLYIDHKFVCVNISTTCIYPPACCIMITLIPRLSIQKKKSWEFFLFFFPGERAWERGYIMTCTYSGNPEGERTILMISLIREAFMMRSLGVVCAIEGEAFTCSINKLCTDKCLLVQIPRSTP